MKICIAGWTQLRVFRQGARFIIASLLTGPESFNLLGRNNVILCISGYFLVYGTTVNFDFFLGGGGR